MRDRLEALQAMVNTKPFALFHLCCDISISIQVLSFPFAVLVPGFGAGSGFIQSLNQFSPFSSVSAPFILKLKGPADDDNLKVSRGCNYERNTSFMDDFFDQVDDGIGWNFAVIL